MWGSKSRVLIVMLVLACLCSTAAMAYNERLGDCVWFDANGDGKTTNPDGTMQAGEYGLNGIVVTLVFHGANGDMVKGSYTTGNEDGYPLTDNFPSPSGFYTFEELFPGDFTVTLSNVPAGLVPTFDLDGIGSEPYTYSARVTLVNGHSKLDVDFGFNYTGPMLYEVGDRVWHDADNNGTQDPGEEGINDATVSLLDEAGNVLATTTTATVGGVDGYYLFNAPAGEYVIAVSGTPVGWACTYDLDLDKDSNSGLFSLSANRYDVDFGYYAAPSTGYSTFTQGGWGSKPSGSNPGAFLEKYFKMLYPYGLTVGGKYKLHFATRAEITNFLPQGGPAASLTKNYPVDGAWPKKTEAGVLAGQVVAVRLNLDFSNAGYTQFGLGSRVIQYGTYNVTVAQFALEAEKVLGGGTSSLYTVSEINYIATGINESFNDGKITGFLK